MTPEELQKELTGLSEENKKLKAARAYRVERMAEFQQAIQDYRHDIQDIDRIVSANTSKYQERAAQLRALSKKK
jgi:hypothetical protein